MLKLDMDKIFLIWLIFGGMLIFLTAGVSLLFGIRFFSSDIQVILMAVWAVGIIILFLKTD